MSRRFKRNSGRSLAMTVGWLFADLLLALGMLFLISSPPRQKLPPTLIASPADLNPADSHCTGGTSKPQCTIVIGETASSQGTMDWRASNDMSNSMNFSPRTGRLSPGKFVTVVVSAFPCQNGSFIFWGSGGASPAMVSWHCTPPPNDRILEHQYCRIQLNVGPPGTFINDSINSARSIVEPQFNRISFLQGRLVGIAIGYGGIIGGTEEQGTQVAAQVYNVLMALARDNRAKMYTVFKTSSLYEPLFTGFETSDTAIINVYLVAQSGRPKETCNAQHQAIL